MRSRIIDFDGLNQNLVYKKNIVFLFEFLIYILEGKDCQFLNFIGKVFNLNVYYFYFENLKIWWYDSDKIKYFGF